MKKWTKADVFLTVCTILASTVLAYFAAGFCGRPGSSVNLTMLVFIPMAGTALLGWFLKKRGRRLRFFAGLLAAFDGLLLLAATNLRVTTQIVHTLTGYYNAEAVAFFMIIPLFCGFGLLIGLGLGALLALPGKRG